MKENFSEQQKENRDGFKKYIFRDNRQHPPLVIFECVSDDILGADEQYKVATGNDPEKQPYIGCEIIPIENDEIKSAE